MIRLLFAVAVGAFVLSLPIHMTVLGASLRRLSGFCFALALVPSIVVGMFFPGGVEAHPIAAGVVAALFVIGAYSVLMIRRRVRAADKPRSLRVQEKVPLDRARRRERDFFAFIAEHQERPEE